MLLQAYIFCARDKIASEGWNSKDERVLRSIKGNTFEKRIIDKNSLNRESNQTLPRNWKSCPKLKVNYT